ncbi:hypothetical protein [Massilia violaceinigra]|uniref:hypothetical protein n=1 Tax=Massilia violaceinigra TaxID=2045208 RepID=UPI001E5D891D|nr:hypothetical protein [Massilia violaceinigra]
MSIPAYPLAPAMLEQIIRLQLDRIKARVEQRYGIRFGYSDAVVELVTLRCTESESGGRMIDAILTNSMLPDISRQFLTRTMEGGAMADIEVGVAHGEFVYIQEFVSKIWPGCVEGSAIGMPVAHGAQGADKIVELAGQRREVKRYLTCHLIDGELNEPRLSMHRNEQVCLLIELKARMKRASGKVRAEGTETQVIHAAVNVVLEYIQSAHGIAQLLMADINLMRKSGRAIGDRYCQLRHVVIRPVFDKLDFRFHGADPFD